MKLYPHLAGLLCAGVVLTSCNPFESNPSAEDMQRSFGAPVDNISCIATQGKPGRTCSFRFKGDSETITRRFLKQEDGWHAVPN